MLDEKLTYKRYYMVKLIIKDGNGTTFST